MQYNFSHSETSEQQIRYNLEKLQAYTEKLRSIADPKDYTENESSLNLPIDSHFLEEAQGMANKYVGDDLKYVVVVGIGGSDLGTGAVYNALFGYYDKLEPGRYPKLIRMDTEEKMYNSKLISLLTQLRPEEFVINIVSKSGKTHETQENMEFLLERLPNIKKRIVITTTQDSQFSKLAEELQLDVLYMPKIVGGRYSVFSNVGLFPLTCLGIECEELLEGAAQVREELLEKNDNLAAVGAAIKFSLYEKGFVVNDNFFYHPALEILGKWYRQLLAESLGKDDKGILPTVSIGSTDMHSLGQLYLGGHKNVFFTFVGVAYEDKLNSILKAVTQTFAEKNIPFEEITLQDITPKILGEYMQYKMLETMYLGQLLQVNAFNQPNVEDYKHKIKS